MIVPTFNNSGTVVDVVSRCLEQCEDVIVVCDGCTDGTPDLLERMPRKPVVISYERNRGKGAALVAGFRYALEHGFSYAITIDSDGQHFPEDIPVMVQANRDFPGSLVVGRRQGPESGIKSAGSKFANSFSNFWFTVQTGHRVKDTQSGFRLYPLKKLPCLSLLTSRYEAEYELLAGAAWRGVGIEEVPVNVHYPPKEERVSHFRPFADFARISVLNVVLCLLALVYGYPRCILRFLGALGRTLYSLTVFILVTLVIITPAMVVYLSVGKLTEKKKERLHDVIYKFTSFGLLRHGIPGAEYTQNNPAGESFDRPAVIICNHQSHFDLLVMLSLTPKMVILTTDWVWNNPFYGYLIRKADFLPVSRGMVSIMPKLKELSGKGYSIAIYPEGTRSVDGKIGRFHQGAFHIAGELGLDILPLILYGTGKVLPKHGRLMHRWPVSLSIDRRIPAAGLRELGATTREQASRMRGYYIRRYNEIADVIERDV